MYQGHSAPNQHGFDMTSSDLFVSWQIYSAYWETIPHQILTHSINYFLKLLPYKFWLKNWLRFKCQDKIKYLVQCMLQFVLFNSVLISLSDDIIGCD